MARSPDYLRDRGLADNAEPPPQVVPFVIGSDGLPTQPAEGVAVLPVGMPDDYGARQFALGVMEQLYREKAFQSWTEGLTAARRFHAFLTATEPVPEKRETHTDA